MRYAYPCTLKVHRFLSFIYVFTRVLPFYFLLSLTPSTTNCQLERESIHAVTRSSNSSPSVSPPESSPRPLPSPPISLPTTAFSAPPFCQPIYNSRGCSRPPCHLPFTVTDSSPTHQAYLSVSVLLFPFKPPVFCGVAQLCDSLLTFFL